MPYQFPNVKVLIWEKKKKNFMSRVLNAIRLPQWALVDAPAQNF